MTRTMRAAEGGFTLIEMLVSIVLLAIGVLGLTGLVVVGSRSNRVQVQTMLRNAALAGEAQRISALPYASIGADACRPLTHNGFSYVRCIEVQDSASVRRLVRVIVRAADSARVRFPTDTAIIIRTAP